MSSPTSLLGLLGLFMLGSGALVACGGAEDGSNASEPTDDELRKTGGGLHAACTAAKKCKPDLFCKPKSSGPPAGAVGLPLPPGSSTSGGPPPGAMGMPLAPSGTCETPDPGTEGGSCSSSVHCHAGLHCEYPSSGPPPGAMGLPVSSSSSGGPPPGAMGLPIQRTGICKPTSSGPPPGAMGLPLNPNP